MSNIVNFRNLSKVRQQLFKKYIYIKPDFNYYIAWHTLRLYGDNWGFSNMRLCQGYTNKLDE